ncbi:hypothetical protein MXB_4528 [Myxobolus squamalis]|nr:hypothetical protein MXB_4528 [Myxobolus squamalis]
MTTLFGAPTDTFDVVKFNSKTDDEENATSSEISRTPSFSNKKKIKHRRTPSHGALEFIEIVLKLMLVFTIFYAIFKIFTQQQMISILENDLYDCKQRNN